MLKYRIPQIVTLTQYPSVKKSRHKKEEPHFCDSSFSLVAEIRLERMTFGL